METQAIRKAKELHEAVRAKILTRQVALGEIDYAGARWAEMIGINGPAEVGKFKDEIKSELWRLLVADDLAKAKRDDAMKTAEGQVAYARFVAENDPERARGALGYAEDCLRELDPHNRKET